MRALAKKNKQKGLTEIPPLWYNINGDFSQKQEL